MKSTSSGSIPCRYRSCAAALSPLPLCVGLWRRARGGVSLSLSSFHSSLSLSVFSPPIPHPRLDPTRLDPNRIDPPHALPLALHPKIDRRQLCVKALGVVLGDAPKVLAVARVVQECCGRGSRRLPLALLLPLLLLVCAHDYRDDAKRGREHCVLQRAPAEGHALAVLAVSRAEEGKVDFGGRHRGVYCGRVGGKVGGGGEAVRQ